MKSNSENPNEALLIAAIEGDVDSVKLALMKGADIETCDSTPHTASPLMLAVIHGHPHVVRYLLDSKADVRCKRTFGGFLSSSHTHSLLHYAAILFPTGNTQIIDMLLGAGLQFDHRLIYKIIQGDILAVKNEVAENPALFDEMMKFGAPQFALANGQLEVVEYFHDQQKNSNKPWKLTEREMFALAKSGSIPLMQWYLDTFTDGKVPNTLLFKVAQTNHTALMNWLLTERNGDINAVSWEKFSLFLLAAGSGNLKMLQFLLLKNPNFINDQGAFSTAACNGHLSIVHYLLPLISDLDKIKDAYLKAAEQNQLGVIKLLDTQHSAKRFGTQLLLTACEKGKIQVIKLLENLGIKLNLRCPKTGITAVMATLRYYFNDEKDSVLQYLLENNPDLSAQDLEGNTAAHHACNARNTTVAVQLVQACPQVIELNKGTSNSLAIIAAKTDCPTVLAEIIRHNREALTMCDEEGLSPLHHAAKENRLKTVAFLVKLAPESLFQEDHAGHTAVYWACFSGYSCEELLACIYVNIDTTEHQQQFINEGRRVRGISPGARLYDAKDTYITLPTITQLEETITSLKMRLSDSRLVLANNGDDILAEIQIVRKKVESLNKLTRNTYTHYNDQLICLKSLFSLKTGSHKAAFDLLIHDLKEIPTNFEDCVSMAASHALSLAMDTQDTQEKDGYYNQANLLFKKIGDEDSFYRLRFGYGSLSHGTEFIQACDAFITEIEPCLIRDDDLDAIRFDSMGLFFLALDSDLELRKKLILKALYSELQLVSMVSSFKHGDPILCATAGKFFLALIQIRDQLNQVSNEMSPIQIIINFHIETLRNYLPQPKPAEDQKLTSTECSL